MAQMRGKQVSAAAVYPWNPENFREGQSRARALGFRV